MTRKQQTRLNSKIRRYLRDPLKTTERLIPNPVDPTQIQVVNERTGYRTPPAGYAEGMTGVDS